MRDNPRLSEDRGSTLLIFPAVTVVLFAMSAIAVDLSLLHLRQRQLVSIVDQAAEDAAGAVDHQELRAEGRASLDGDLARRVALADLTSSSLANDLIGTPDVRIRPDGLTIEVAATVRVPRLFAGVMPYVGGEHDSVSAIGLGRLVRMEDR